MTDTGAEPSERLDGGINAVVRLGETVRRPVAPENVAWMGWPAPPAMRERLTRVREGYGCTDSQGEELVATIPLRVQAAYDTMRIWAAEDRPGWKAQWEQPEPWRHGAGYLRDLDFIRGSLDFLLER